MDTQRTPIPSILALLCLALALIATACATDAMASTEAPKCAGVTSPVTHGQPQDRIGYVTQNLSCRAGTYALCYYSGAAPMPCTVEESQKSADCQCQVFKAEPLPTLPTPEGPDHPVLGRGPQPMYVLMTGILNDCVYNEAIEQCGTDGTKCYNMCTDYPNWEACNNSGNKADQVEAYVCGYIEQGTFMSASEPSAPADPPLISTFSYQEVFPIDYSSSFEFDCNEMSGQYAGCMTAACSASVRHGDHFYTTCGCPVWPPDKNTPPDDYQFGRRCKKAPTGNCLLESENNELIWSAAYNPDGCPK